MGPICLLHYVRSKSVRGAGQTNWLGSLLASQLSSLSKCCCVGLLISCGKVSTLTSLLVNFLIRIAKRMKKEGRLFHDQQRGVVVPRKLFGNASFFATDYDYKFSGKSLSYRCCCCCCCCGGDRRPLRKSLPHNMVITAEYTTTAAAAAPIPDRSFHNPTSLKSVDQRFCTKENRGSTDFMYLKLGNVWLVGPLHMCHQASANVWIGLETCKCNG